MTLDNDVKTVDMIEEGKGIGRLRKGGNREEQRGRVGKRVQWRRETEERA